MLLEITSGILFVIALILLVTLFPRISRSGDSVKKLLEAATVLEHRGRLDEALDAYRDVARLAPLTPPAERFVDLAIARKRHTAEAVAVCREILRHRPEDVPALYRLGATLEQEGQIGGACDAWRRVLELDQGVWAARAQERLGSLRN